MQSRLSRGFARLALVVSGPMVLIAAACAVSELYQASLPASGQGLPGQVPSQHVADFTVALILLGLAALVYGLTRGVAWVIDGFGAPPQAHA